jgi:hypothetical protein
MSPYEVVAVALSSVALLATGVNIFFYFKLTKEYNGLVKEQNKIAQGQAETSMRELIMSARRNVETVSEKVAGQDAKDKTIKAIYEQMFDSAQEDLRNAYEEACSRYRDGKVDKERFKRMYSTEIRQLVEDEAQKKEYDTISTRYECTVAVYKEWFQLEK